MDATLNISERQDDWPAAFAASGLDVIPDPMMMRISDLFIGGKSFAAQANLDADRVWKAIERNADSLTAFFHLLMTRDRIPLIDYEYTFNTTNFEALGNVAVAMHSPVYQEIKKQAQLKLQAVDLTRLPVARRDELAAETAVELESVGYNWFPDPGIEFKGDDRLLATLLLGSLIFGGYAQVSGADHVLQTTGSRLLLELTEPGDAPHWVGQQERQLFSRLNNVVARDPRLSSLDARLPPTVLPFLIEQGATNPRDLLDKALNLREKDTDFIAYRRWYRELREAWANGTHNEVREKDVIDVTKELTRRYPPGKDPFDTPPIWSREIGVKATVAAKAIAEVGVEADAGKVMVSFPDWIRNWLVEGIQFRNHRKILLRMALAKRHSDHLLLGLRRLWDNTGL